MQGSTPGTRVNIGDKSPSNTPLWPSKNSIIVQLTTQLGFRVAFGTRPIEKSSQKHFVWIIDGPASSYSCFETHICWNVLREDKMEPPIQTEYFRSGGATTLIFIVDGARAVSSFVMRSPMPWNIVVPPESTTFAYKSLRMSTSHFMMDWNVVSWIPDASLPMKLGWNKTSAQRNRSLPTVMIL